MIKDLQLCDRRYAGSGSRRDGSVGSPPTKLKRLSEHALSSGGRSSQCSYTRGSGLVKLKDWWVRMSALSRSEEHTSELQSRPHLVCRLLLEKKKKTRHASLSVGSALH